jgi:hypothetical protein
MASENDDPRSRGQEFEKRLEEWIESAREGIERQAPEVLDKLASTARDLAQRLDRLANDARQRHAGKDATADAAGTSEVETETEAAGGPATSEQSEGPSSTSGEATTPPSERA